MNTRHLFGRHFPGRLSLGQRSFALFFLVTVQMPCRNYNLMIREEVEKYFKTEVSP